MIRPTAVLFLFLVCHGAVAAQVEFGIDGGFEIESFAEVDDNLTTFALPSDMFRLGFWASETVGVEFRTSLARQAQGDASATLLGLGAALRARLSAMDWDRAAPFLRGGAGLTYRDFDESDTQFYVTGGVGVDIPVAEPVAFRLEARYQRHFESDDMRASHTFAALIGLTVVVPSG